MYKCVATDAGGNRTYNSITVGVIRTGMSCTVCVCVQHDSWCLTEPAREEPADSDDGDDADAVLAGIAGGDHDCKSQCF